MRTGEVEASLRHLNESARMSFVDDLIERKLAGPEKSQLPEADLSLREGEYHRLVAELESASEKSHLPELPSGKDALNDLLVRLRLSDRRAKEDKGIST
jgi:hypothetical protein